jgi:glycosyltransferase involved in cell wall biosynthesis
VAERIAQAYSRHSAVLHPPVNTDFFTPADRLREDFYLMVTAMSPYKKVDQAIEACRLAGRRLLIIGSGPELRRLKRRSGAAAQFLGWQGDDVVRDHYRRCRAVLFPQVEDFGIVPLEAFACGAPVIALAKGGALETVRDAADSTISDPTGLLYEPQMPEELAAAISKFESPAIQARLSTANLRRWAEQFAPERFVAKFKQIVEPLLAERGFSAPW